MATLVDAERSYFSVVKVLRAADPKEELIGELVAFLRPHLRSLGIRWNPEAFRRGLTNPELPEELLSKLEDFLGIAQALNWALPKSVVEELDGIVEDIETFNPVFLERLRLSRSSGRIPSGLIKKRVGG